MLTSVEMLTEGEKRPPKYFSSENIVFKNKRGTLCLLQQREASGFRIIRGMLLELSNEKTRTL